MVHARANSVDMDLAGQTLFNRELMKPFEPRSVQSIALCYEYDSVIGPLLEQHAGCRVVVWPGDKAAA